MLQALLGIVWFIVLFGAPGALLAPRLLALRREDPIARAFLTVACGLPLVLAVVAIAAQASLQVGHLSPLLQWAPLIACASALVIAMIVRYAAQARRRSSGGQDAAERKAPLSTDKRLAVPVAILAGCVMLAVVIPEAIAPQGKPMVEFSLPVEQHGFGAYIVDGVGEAQVVVPYEVSNGTSELATFMVCAGHEIGEFLWCSPATHLEGGSVWRGAAIVRVAGDLPPYLDLLLWVFDSTEPFARLRLWLQEAEVRPERGGLTEHSAGLAAARGRGG